MLQSLSRLSQSQNQFHFFALFFFLLVYFYHPLKLFNVTLLITCFSASLIYFQLLLSINFIPPVYQSSPLILFLSFSFFSSPEIDFLHRFKISLSDWIFCRNRWDRWTKVTTKTKTKTLIAFHQFFFRLKKGKQSFLISA